MSRPANQPAREPARGGRWEDCLPILDLSAGLPDPMSIATWHLALANLVATEVPSELFALWAFPASGGVLLLGPEAMASSQLALPEPAPHLTQDQLFQLEEVLRRAKYASALALPIREGDRDVGLLLVGAFAAGQFTPARAISLQRVARRLGPSLGQFSRSVRATGHQATVAPSMTADELPNALAQLVVEAPTALELVRRASGLLLPAVPHDRFEILTTPTERGPVVALSGQGPRRRWGSPAPHWADLIEGLERLAGDDATVAIDLSTDALELAWPGAEPTRQPGSLVAARMTLGGLPVGWVIAGHVAQGIYRPDDESMLAVVARHVAARVAAFRLEAEADHLAARLEALNAPALPIIRAAIALGETAHLGEALHRVEVEMHEALGAQRATYLLLANEDEYLEFRSDGLRPLADLPLLPVEGSPFAPVLTGARTTLHERVDSRERLSAALRVADRVVGVLVVDADRFERPREALALASEFAAVLAPHLELIRRGAVLPKRVRA